MQNLDYKLKYIKYKQKYENLLTQSGGLKEYDYIICGGGTAGCVLAEKLSKNSNKTILLLEAGPIFKSDKFPKELTDPTIIGSEHYDWNYSAIPTFHIDRKIEIPRAKTLAGCSAHNGTVTLRATAHDLDKRWSKHIDGWKFNDVLPYYKLLENTNYGSKEWHGKTGPLSIRQDNINNLTIPCQAFMQSAINNGFDFITDFNNGKQNGVGMAPRNVLNNIRQNTAIAYLTNKVRKRSNLEIKGHSEIDKVIFSNKQAIGVQLVNKKIIYGKNIILCAGVYGSPAILSRSGIAPKSELMNLNIEQVIDLPVGKILYDQPAYYMEYKLKSNIKNNDNISTIGATLWTNSINVTKEELDIHIIAFNPDDNDSTIGIALVLMHPESVGSLKLKNKNPKSAPIIDINMLSNPIDRNKLVQAIRLVRKIVETEPLNNLIEKEITPGIDKKTNKELENEILKEADSFAHGCCTLPMGSVVDQNGKVYGIDNLRVVDASIFPLPISAPPNLTVIMVAEKIANHIVTSE
ncbi:MAG: dehydrogenase [Edafosvirus sp.]|uniref:Dehydrogenase n=1 Tax=Edafosvirus sp. TaxID=2487765 RepID=A0A3G4ZVD7_9VIRU|nr:MAG: dehydrogenase [Edafosvirus sp.]